MFFMTWWVGITVKHAEAEWSEGTWCGWDGEKSGGDCNSEKVREVASSRQQPQPPAGGAPRFKTARRPDHRCTPPLPQRNPHLLRLALDALAGKVLGARHDAELPRHVQRVAGADRLAVRAQRRGRAAGDGWGAGGVRPRWRAARKERRGTAQRRAGRRTDRWR